MRLQAVFLPYLFPVCTSRMPRKTRVASFAMPLRLQSGLQSEPHGIPRKPRPRGIPWPAKDGRYSNKHHDTQTHNNNNNNPPNHDTDANTLGTGWGNEVVWRTSGQMGDALLARCLLNHDQSHPLQFAHRHVQVFLSHFSHRFPTGLNNPLNL